MRHLFGIALLCGVAYASKAAGQDLLPLQIKVVKTWKELSEQPAIELKSGGTVRLGIEAMAAPLNSGVVLYCIADGVPIELKLDTPSENVLGPVCLKAESPGEKTVAKKVMRQLAHNPYHDKIEKGRALIIQLITMPDHGRRHVTVMNKANNIFATVDISCSEDVYQPWVGFADDPKLVALEAVDSKPYVPEARVIAAMGGKQLPAIDGSQPVLVILDNGQRLPLEFKDDVALPALLRSTSGAQVSPPDKVPEATIKMDKMNLEVTTQLHFENTYFQDKFIARWWVNSKPVENFISPQGINRVGSGQVTLCKRGRLNLRFLPESIGARQGDKIGLQLLFCPDGSRGIGADARESMAAAEYDANGEDAIMRFPMLSNKIEFVAQ